MYVCMKSKVVRKTRERCLNNRRQHAGSQTLLQNGEHKRKHESLVTLLPGTCLETKSVYSPFVFIS